MNSAPYQDTVRQSPQSQRWVFWILVAANLLVLLKYFQDSFWLDECGTMWLIDGGFSSLIPRSRLLLHGPLFGGIMAATSAIGGNSELVMRLPSWLAVGLSIYFFALLAHDLLEPDTAKTALAFFTLWPIVGDAAIEARPYAFAMAALCATFLCFLRATRYGRFRDFAGFSLGLICLVYLQLLFIYVLPVPLLYLLLSARDSWRRNQFNWMISAAAILLALLPLLAHYQVMFGWGSGYSWAPKPDLLALIWTFAPLKTLFVFVLATIACSVWIRKLKRPVSTPDPFSLSFCLISVLFPVLLLFAISTLTQTRLFVPRYLMPATPGLALFWGWLLGRIQPSHLCLRIGIGALAISLLAHSVFDSWHKKLEDWRGALARVNQLEQDPEATLILYSSFVESASLKVLKNPEQRSFLLSPLVPYPVSAQKISVLPLEPTASARAYSDAFLSSNAWNNQRFTVVLRQTFHHLAWRKLLSNEAYRRGFLLANEELFPGEIPVLLLHFKRSE